MANMTDVAIDEDEIYAARWAEMEAALPMDTKAPTMWDDPAIIAMALLIVYEDLTYSPRLSLQRQRALGQMLAQAFPNVLSTSESEAEA